MRKHLGEIFLIITAVIWGSGFVANAIALDHWTPYQILAGRFLIGAAMLIAIFYRNIGSLNKKTIIQGVILGIFLYAAFALQTVGLQYTTPSKNAFLTAVNVVIVPFLALVLYRRKIDFFELSGAILAMIGVGVLSLKVNGAVNIGDLLTLGCAVFFALQIFYTAKYVKDSDPILLTLVQISTAAVIGVLVVAFKGDPIVAVEREGILSLVYLGVFSTTIAYLLQTMAQKWLSETTAAIILSTESFWGMVFSVALLAEVMTFKMVIGAALILCAIIISETKFSFFKRKKLEEIG
ncbi:DMT family transporter [Planococcus sp. N028]|uniref:DMT family transporter n=1 Tax=Planococcus shixiaomingii TaxID=3058393 RepID=A0ABT8N2Q1_9BACL|nr:DMT family transporter [Planococcus sp. N028]MDN7242172.1 DMT family transporter [Planococcus sp. N028]